MQYVVFIKHLALAIGWEPELDANFKQGRRWPVQSTTLTSSSNVGSICCMITLPLFPFLYPLLVPCFVVGSFLCLGHLDLDGLSQTRMDLVGVGLVAVVKLAQETLVGPLLAILAGVLEGEAQWVEDPSSLDAGPFQNTLAIEDVHPCRGLASSTLSESGDAN